MIALVGALLATNQPLAVSNLVAQQTGVRLDVTDPNDPVEQEYQKLLADDDNAQTEVAHWVRDNAALGEKGVGAPRATLALRIEQRLAPVRKEYEYFFQRHPNHVRARLAFGSFLDDIQDEEGAVVQWEKARELDPKNPAAWNNLANYYGHRGPVTNAFAYYQKAIAINSNEPLYYQNFATTVFLFRRDAEEFYHINEQQVFDRALELYRQALKLNPTSFVLASDLAETYYGIKPARLKEAMDAWNYALKVAGNPEEREGVYLHLARYEMNSGRFGEARQHLNSVTNAMYAELRKRLVRNLEAKEKKEHGTNAPAATIEKK
ncbi:MAG: tetratricopeptide repeat protein [Limisphaerales bacterium]